MLLKKLELHGFKSFAKKSEFLFNVPVTAIVGPNGSGKSNVVEAMRFVLGEQSPKSLRSKTGADLVFAGSKKIPKMSRASVEIIFDNTKRIFKLTNAKNEKVNVDFDEIIISREVYSDSVNVYKINDQEVRLRDIHELIASVHIGSSGHHIISQGEADRLLNANAKERREMIEEALGLKLYHFRIKETQRKLEYTKENLKQSESLRREIAPHLKFLEREVKKIEEGEQLRLELRIAYERYFARAIVHITERQKEIQDKKQVFENNRNTLKEKLAVLAQGQESRSITPEEKHLETLEQELRNLYRKKDELGRVSGRLEGMIDMAERYVPPMSHAGSLQVPPEVIEKMIEDVEDIIASVISIDDVATLKQQFTKIQKIIESLKETRTEEKKTVDEPRADIHALKNELVGIKKQLSDIEMQEQNIESQVRDARNSIKRNDEIRKEDQLAYFDTKSALQKIEGELSMLGLREEDVLHAQHQFENEEREAFALLGEKIIYTSVSTVASSWSQEQELKTIERMKIRLETIGGGSGVDTIKEFEETKERDRFLAQETIDLEGSINALEVMIAELEEELTKEFLVGIKKISTQFQEFFAILFGGGNASLKVITIERRRRKNIEEGEEVILEEINEEDQETGIDIDVSLPRKKIKDIEMLSGGERSLASIALLFALSQVNPPPFLVLDETDAALDEANSTRYGDMLEKLSHYSQLIVVTHNRETMSRAQTLYGVTMGSMECSQLLSVKLDDAVEWAK